MFPARREHRFTLDGESYLLVGWTRGADRRIRADLAASLATAPDILNAIDGADLYAEAVARECLKEAPAMFWKTAPPTPADNGTPRRVVDVEEVPLEIWTAFLNEVNTFVDLFRSPALPVAVHATDAGEAGPDAVAIAEAVSARPRMRAE